MWAVFEYESGANPYIAFNEKEARRVIRKWKKKGASVKHIETDALFTRWYLVCDKEVM